MSKWKESDLDSSPPPPRSSSLNFLKPNGIHNPYDFSDTELVSINSGNFSSSSSNSNTTNSSSSCGNAHYTSLRDILPTTPSPPPGISPTHNSSWREIPIRNQLVKQAAWAYLQPMSAPPESGDRGVFSKLKSVCCEVGCFEYFRESIVRFLFDRRDSDDDEKAACDEDEDGYCCGGGKVD
uniref:Uncharacterized protein n=1 Tax=Kalanchoe fedtschenkoi TaxID=63787 RepID=A0A7N1A001_KALFE